MGKQLAVFRGSSRLEYRNQNIKLLRALEGEVTRASYRLLWVHDDVRRLLADEPNALATAVLVDGTNTRGLPLRQMVVVDHRFDVDAGFLYLTFSLGPFVGTMLDFTDDLTAWTDGASLCPPERFVSEWQNSWPSTVELSDADGLRRWREAIDFLTPTWDFGSTAFLRLDHPAASVDVGPSVDALENRDLRIDIRSYNPHLAARDIERMRIRVAQSGGLISVESGANLQVVRDGTTSLRLRCLEPGTAHVDVTVDPDPQFSTFLPITLNVAADPEMATGRPRVLGREWQNCLDGLESHLLANPDLHLTVLDLLGRVFPDDPTVLQHKGRIHYRAGHLAEARHAFDTALSMREDADTVALNLFAALRRNDVNDALELLTKLNLSHYELFDQLIQVVGELPECVNLAVARKAPAVFGDEKAIRLLSAMESTITSEPAGCELAAVMRTIDAERSLAFLLRTVDLHADWSRALRLLIEVADQVDRVEGVERHAQQALRWNCGEDPSTFIGRWYRFRRLLPTPDIRIAVSMSNVRQMLACRPGDVAVPAELALEAAETAFSQGDLLVAQSALTLIFANVRDSTDEAQVVLSAARELEQRISAVLSEIDTVERGSTQYIQRLHQQLRPWTNGKTLVIAGLATRPSHAKDWEAALGVSIVWLGSSDADHLNEKRIRAFDPTRLIVVVLWEHMSHLQANTKQWLKRNNVPIAFTPGSGNMLLEVLRDELARRAH